MFFVKIITLLIISTQSFSADWTESKDLVSGMKSLYVVNISGEQEIVCKAGILETEASQNAVGGSEGIFLWVEVGSSDNGILSSLQFYSVRKLEGRLTNQIDLSRVAVTFKIGDSFEVVDWDRVDRFAQYCNHSIAKIPDNVVREILINFFKLNQT